MSLCFLFVFVFADVNINSKEKEKRKWWSLLLKLTIWGSCLIHLHISDSEFHYFEGHLVNNIHVY